MKEFEPSPDFVSRVMASIPAKHQAHAVPDPWLAVTLSRPLRWAVTLGGGLIAGVNMIRMMASILAPSLCG
jgi:hypothetical protein